MAGLTKQEFLDKWAFKFADNTIQNITEATFRDFRQDLADSFAGSAPNQRPGGPFYVIFLTKAEAVAAGRADDDTLDQLDPEKFCLGATVRVDLHPAGNGLVLTLCYDARPAGSAGQVLVYLGGSFHGARTIPARWLAAADPAAVTANVPLLDATRTNYPQGFLVQAVYNARNYLFEAVAAGGPFPAPLDYTGTPDWQPVALPLPAGVLSAACDLGYVRAVMLPTGGVEAGVLYRLTGQWNGGATVETVEVEGGQGGFAAQGTLVAGGTRRAVQVDVAAGTYHAFSSQFADLLGQPGDNAALAAALHQLSNDTLTQAQRIDAVLHALAPLQADPTTKTYVDNLVQAISTIDANQAAAIQQLQQHLASDDNLLTGLLSTQNTQGQAIAGNTKQLNTNTDLLTAHSQLLQNTLNLTGAQTKSGTVTFLDYVTAYYFITGFVKSNNGQLDLAITTDGIHAQLRSVLDNNGLLVESTSLPLVDIQLRNKLHYANLRLESRPGLMRNGGEDGEIQLRHPTPGSYSSLSTFVISRNYFIVANKKVGIGVDTPTEALEVNGTAKVSRLFVNGVEITGSGGGGGGTPYSAGAGMDLTGTVFSTQAGKHRGDYFKGHFGSAKNGQGGFTPPSLGTYFAVPLTVDKDDNGNWDASRNAYRCPVNGLYAIASKGQPGYPSYSSVGNDFYFGPGFNEIAANEDGVWGQVSPSTRGGKPDYTEQYCVAGTFIYPVLCELGASDSNNPNPNNNSTFPAVGGFTVRLIDAY